MLIDDQYSIDETRMLKDELHSWMNFVHSFMNIDVTADVDASGGELLWDVICDNVPPRVPWDIIRDIDVPPTLNSSFIPYWMNPIFVPG